MRTALQQIDDLRAVVMATPLPVPPRTLQPHARPEGVRRLPASLPMRRSVYKAHRSPLPVGADVAVKIMPTSVIRTACKEVMALTRLNNPHVVQLLSVQV